MNCLALLYLLTIVSVKCVYAQFSPKAPNDVGLYQPFHLYNPFNGKKLVPFNYLDSRNVNNNLIELPTLGLPCLCQDYTCKCCLGLGFGMSKDGLCVLVSYRWRDLSVHFAVEINQRSVTSFDISPRNLPDFCTAVILPAPASACLRLYDIHVSETSLYVCISMVFKLLFKQLFEYKLNCLDLSWKGVSIADSNSWNMPEVDLSSNQKLKNVQSYNNKLEGFAI